MSHDSRVWLNKITKLRVSQVFVNVGTLVLDTSRYILTYIMYGI